MKILNSNVVVVVIAHSKIAFRVYSTPTGRSHKSAARADYLTSIFHKVV